MVLVLGFLFGLGLTLFQAADLAVTAWKIDQAAHIAAYAASSSNAPASSDQTPCWAVADGLLHPGQMRDAAVCRAVAANLAGLDPRLTSVSVSASPASIAGEHSTIQVTINYKQPVSSPLVRWLIGPTFNTTSEATFVE